VIPERAAIAFTILILSWAAYMALRAIFKSTYVQYYVFLIGSLAVGGILYPFVKEYAVIPGLLMLAYEVLAYPILKILKNKPK